MEADRIFLTNDGSHSVLSGQFGVPYHSRFGAIQETQHVFLDAGLHYFSNQIKEIAILETGLGTGLNALMTAIEAEKYNIKINYTSLEAFPVSEEIAAQLNFAERLSHPETSSYLNQIHQPVWDEFYKISEHFNFKKLNIKFQELSIKNSFHIIYFDAFAPNAQPELWEIDLLTKMYDALLPDGILVTYCAKGAVRRNLQAVGFDVEKLPGPPGKREMLRGVKKMG